MDCVRRNDHAVDFDHVLFPALTTKEKYPLARMLKAGVREQAVHDLRGNDNLLDGHIFRFSSRSTGLNVSGLPDKEFKKATTRLDSE